MGKPLLLEYQRVFRGRVDPETYRPAAEPGNILPGLYPEIPDLAGKPDTHIRDRAPHWAAGFTSQRPDPAAAGLPKDRHRPFKAADRGKYQVQSKESVKGVPFPLG